VDTEIAQTRGDLPS